MKKTTITLKLMHAIKHIGAQKMSIKYSVADQETWKALHDAQKILDNALWSVLRS